MAISSQSTDLLKTSIDESLKRFGDKILIQDENIALLGTQIESVIKSLSQIIIQNSKPGGRIGICLKNSANLGVAILTVIHSGRIPIILNYIDVLERPLAWVRNSHTNLFITSTEISDITDVNCICFEKNLSIRVDFKNSSIAQDLDQVVFHPPLGTALILYTSGSTGEPKEIFIPEQGLLDTCNYLINYFGLTQKTIASIVLPACHSMALNTQFFPTFFAGGTSCFLDLRLNINRVFRTMLAEKSTFGALIGEVVRICWEEKNKRNLEPHLNIKHLQLAGGLISNRHLEMTRELFPNAVIHKGYGLTEAIRVTMISSDDPLFMTASVGKPLPFLEAQIRNELGETLGPNTLGQLYIRGSSVMIGKRKASELLYKIIDRENFMPTGDLAEMDQDSNISILGRVDSLFKVNGKRISGFEIEKASLANSKSFRHAKCIAVEDESKDRTKLVLFIEIDKDLIKRGKISITPAIEKTLWDNLKVLSFYPKDIIFLKHMPRTSNGKLDIKSLHTIWKLKSHQMIKNQTEINLTFFKIEEMIA